jgi:hypothetical protein
LGTEERRVNRRYIMKLPLLVRWASGADAVEATTVSEDLSSRGVYFKVPAEPECGAALEIVMTLPPEVANSSRPVRVRCLGHVLRATMNGQQIGVAAKIDRYVFLPAVASPA